MTDSFKMKVKIVQTRETVVELDSRQYHIEDKEHMLKCELQNAEHHYDYFDWFEDVDVKTETTIEEIEND